MKTCSDWLTFFFENAYFFAQKTILALKTVFNAVKVTAALLFDVMSLSRKYLKIIKLFHAKPFRTPLTRNLIYRFWENEHQQRNDAEVITKTRFPHKQAKISMKMSSNRKNKCENCSKIRAFRLHFLAIWSLKTIGNTLKIALKVDLFFEM